VRKTKVHVKRLTQVRARTMVAHDPRRAWRDSFGAVIAAPRVAAEKRRAAVTGPATITIQVVVMRAMSTPIPWAGPAKIGR
jgi:hypothetical protein